jgi:hypothetical protein
MPLTHCHSPPLCSLARNGLCGLDHRGEGTYTSEGITKLCEALKGSAVTSLKCAAPPPPQCPLFCQRPSTRLLSHRYHPAPPLQSLRQLHWSQGRHCTRRHPQQDTDHQLEVRHRPRVFDLLSSPLDTLDLCSVLLAHSLGLNDIGDEGATKLAAVIKETKITTLKCATAREVFGPLTHICGHTSSHFIVFTSHTPFLAFLPCVVEMYVLARKRTCSHCASLFNLPIHTVLPSIVRRVDGQPTHIGHASPVRRVLTRALPA